MSTYEEINARELLADAKFFEGYSRWNDEKNRYETWEEAVERVMHMHQGFYSDKMSPELVKFLDEAEEQYKKKYVLGAQRALQFGGDQLLKHQMRIYNCTSSYADRAEFFGEIFYILLCGAGAGFSVQKRHVSRLPDIQVRKKSPKMHIVEDSIEGWATSVDVLLSSYFVGGGKHPEYEGRKVYFDLSNIRPQGAMISGGFKAPGPEPLRKALDKIEHLIQGLVLSGKTRLRPIDAYDIVMYEADAVLAGGVRRSATICWFDVDDEEMMNAKTGDWYFTNPQRARSNNSAAIIRSNTKKSDFTRIMKSVREFGEPGFVFFENEDHATNPCVEIGMYPQHDGVSGWQGCNLTEINGSMCTTEEEFFKACRASAIIGTLQAGYTDFKFLSETSKKIFDREALLGCSITGWMNNPHILLNEDILRKGARLIKEINEQVATLIGINPAARTTCVKPAGNASVLLQTASGVHPEHSPRYIRNVQMNKDTEVAQLIKEMNPYMVEESVWSANKTDFVISFPVIAPETSVFKEQLAGVDFLEKIKMIQQTWVEEGTNTARCVDPTVRHNVSNTVLVRNGEWDSVEDFLFDNRQYFAGVSFIPQTGDKDYNQAPNTQVLTHSEISDEYGPGAFFASGLIVDSVSGFDNLWDACFIAQMESDNGDREKADLRVDWIRRFRNFADNYFNGNRKLAEYCLKDVYLLHKWHKIQQNYTEIHFAQQLKNKKYTEIDTTGAAACIGGGCEI